MAKKSPITRIQHIAEGPAVLAPEFAQAIEAIVEANGWLIRGGKVRQTFIIDLTRTEKEILEELRDLLRVMRSRSVTRV